MLTAELILTEDEKDGIAALVAHYPIARAACIDALKLVQANRRYIADDVLAAIACLLSMSVAELDEVATFYNLIYRQPVGETVILLCDSVTCWMMGRNKIATRIGERLSILDGETTADGKYTLLPIVCLGHCDHAPAMLLGQTLIGDLDTTKIDKLLSEKKQ
ncbi:MAG TPA: NADH-quinone oxidoreductase subunit NuoE [Acidocella sp.]|nr:MAG: NADH-quinone oxidoreductase subunit E [Rhodospirillales bacterium 20-58-10]HQT37951.1 NADH-quinone oxidoreductase subunit NuoE [Acidocella sp.]